MENNKREYFSLTHSQKRIWYTDRVNSNASLHNIGGCLEIYGNADIERLKETVLIIIRQNNGLRLRFEEKDGQPFQYINKYNYEEIDYLDFSNYEKTEIVHEEWSKSLFETKFQIEESKLYYFAIYKLSEEKYGILLKIHHIISDGWSISLIQRNICEIYTKLSMNKKIDEIESYSYLDYIMDEKQYLNSQRFIRNRKFWNEKFKDMPEEFLYQSSNNMEARRISFKLDLDLSKRIKYMAKINDNSIHTFFLLVILIYINKMTSKKDIVLGSPVFNRTTSEQKNIIGMFTSTVPFRFILDTDLNIEDIMNQVNKEFKFCLLNQKYPYDLLIKDLGFNKTGYDSLFKISVNYYNSVFADKLDGMDVVAHEYHCGKQSYSLQIIIKEFQHEQIALDFDYKTSEYSELQIRGMYSSLINIIEEIAVKPNSKIGNIKLLSKNEIVNKVFSLNSTDSFVPDKTVCELFEEQVEKTPNKIALEFCEKKLSYKQLNEQVNQLSNYLRQNGINRESIVAIMINHCIDLVVGILAILKAGGAYLPIAPEIPVGRINYMLNDSNSSMLLTNSTTYKEIGYRCNIVQINKINLDLYSKGNPLPISGSKNLAYIIYTSGTTGKPKGVMIEHFGLTNYLYWAKKMYMKDKDESMALYSSISFDLTVTSLFTPLISGNKIIIYDTDDCEFVLHKILRENKTSILKLTPAHLSLIRDLDNHNSNIKRLIVGGEELKVNLTKKIYDSFGKNIEIFNEYGPTETVVGCMIHKYNEASDRNLSVPIGVPADNVQIYILDHNLEVVPTGFVGELYISGKGVSRGYLNREDLTRKKFIENPFIKGKQMYKTGDTARYLENGSIEYLGRSDKQVKIRGHRIELLEIEKYLLENQFITDSVVILKENLNENKLLIAYLVGRKKLEDIELKNWLINFLPNYMIPNHFIYMNEFPLTSNGKIDYLQLPEPEIVKKEFIKCKTSVEQSLVNIMEEVLGVQHISMNDNFYQLGGDSIKAIQISSKLKEKGLRIKVKDILAFDTIIEIIASIEEDYEMNFISQKIKMGIISKTPITEYFFSQHLNNENFYFQYVLMKFNKLFDKNYVRMAVDKLIEHHDALRVNCSKKDHRLYYNNDYLIQNNAFHYFDFTKHGNAIDFNSIIYEASENLDIENNILFHVFIYKLDDEREALLFLAHHLIIDGVSWRIILKDFSRILNQLEKKESINMPLKTHSLKEWADELKKYCNKDFADEQMYWNTILGKKVVYPLVSEEVDIVKTSTLLNQELDKDFANNLIRKANDIFNIDFNEVLIIALALVISKVSKKETILIELERHGRKEISDFIDVSETVGWFTSIYPVSINVWENDLSSNIKSIKEQLRNIPENGFNYSIIKYLKEQLPNNKDKYVRFNYLGDMDNIMDKDKLNYTDIEFGLESAKENQLTALIDINVLIVNENLKISILYSNTRFKDDVMQNFMKCYIETLRLILDECESKNIKEFTPSDFEVANISQEDLDALLG